ncbi:MAG: SOS response-associated peptidase [Terracidiphilus sp.]|nr:SOS response-associated peptidase [Terracidiphilus sp.]
MCGRYRRRSTKEKIAELFEVEHGLEELEIEPEDDIAPGSIQPVVYLTPEGDRRIAPMRWGFKLPDRFLFNTRSEGVEHSRFWQEAFRERRCLVPADSFFEWTHDSPRAKTKFEFAVRNGAPFGMAGLWSSWLNPRTNQWEQTFSILTGEANEVMQPIHSRQPEILSPRDYSEYLAPTPRPPLHLLRILPGEEMKAKSVTEPKKEKPQQGLLFDDGEETRDR